MRGELSYNSEQRNTKRKSSNEVKHMKDSSVKSGPFFSAYGNTGVRNSVPELRSST